MIVIPEAAIGGLITPHDCFDAVEKVFASMARDKARNFPVVREAIGHADALYGFKSGFDSESLALGVKSGGFWPGNRDKGLINHQSTIVLFDADTGRCKAVVGGNLLTALRTAAASAISIKYLARDDALTLGMIGAGHQSAFQLRAAIQQRPFERVIAWNFHPEMLAGLEAVARDLGLSFEAVELERLGAEADVIITITSSFAPILYGSHVRPGTHLACMGTDTRGKQEVESALVASATVFTDERIQAVTIGECQHAVHAGTLQESAITEIGRVINGDVTGRSSRDEVTLFDGTGIGLQDLAVANVVVENAMANDVGTVVDF